MLLTVAADYENALGCYMDIKIDPSAAAPATSSDALDGGHDSSNSLSALSSALSSASSKGNLSMEQTAQRVLKESGQVVNNIQAQATHNEYKHVFDLFEQQPGLFKSIEYKVINLVRLSRPLSAKLLIGNTDKLPIKSVASQLSADRKLLHWYLHELFTNAPDIYCSPEYSDLHLRQMELYAEFAPKPKQSAPVSATATSAPPAAVTSTRVKTHDSDFLMFLRANLVPAKQALAECERQDPPLYTEMIYLLSQLNRQKEALQLHLHKIGDVSLAIEFIENSLEGGASLNLHGDVSALSTAEKRLGRRLNHDDDEHDGHSSSAAAAKLRSRQQHTENPLWDDLIAHALAHQDYLEQMLDYLGICKLPPELLIREIRNNPTIPYLKLRLCRIISQLEFQVFLNERCNVLLEEDALSLLRQQNQGQRKAMKVCIRLFVKFICIWFMRCPECRSSRRCAARPVRAPYAWILVVP